jgi:hypothetical protein
MVGFTSLRPPTVRIIAQQQSRADCVSLGGKVESDQAALGNATRIWKSAYIRARSSVDRALASGARGHRFESCRAYRKTPSTDKVFGLYLSSVWAT